MRQAGRYMPEYRAVRERLGFLALCKSPDAAAEVTVMAATRLGVDAAIVFADILLVLEPMGVGLEFTRGDGPVIQRPVRTGADVDRLADVEPGALDYVAEAVRRARRALPAGIPLIGLDWRVDRDAAWARVGYDVAVQGNLDPAALLAPVAEIRRRAATILDRAAARPGHIFNLGHGVLPTTPPDHVRALVDAVHE